MKKMMIVTSMTLIGAAGFGLSAFAQNAPPNPQPSANSMPPQTDAPAQVKVGDTVYDPSGSPVGTIQAVQTTTAALSTGTMTVNLPLSAIRQGSKGLMIPMTRAEVEASAKPSASPPK